MRSKSASDLCRRGQSNVQSAVLIVTCCWSLQLQARNVLASCDAVPSGSGACKLQTPSRITGVGEDGI